MFTGIIQALGQVVSITPVGGDMRLHVRSEALDWSRIKLGDSIAVNGVCLTATELGTNSFSADVSKETLSKTSIGQVRPGSNVNLENALSMGDSLGGHLVSGHVDGLAELKSKKSEGRSVRFVFQAPEELARFIAAKGSVCLDGVSLTVNSVKLNEFDVNIIPHTLEETIFADYVVGTRVNLEIDLIARYLERLILAQGGTMQTPLSQENLKKAGFGKTE